jgi:hypothetical protein
MARPPAFALLFIHAKNVPTQAVASPTQKARIMPLLPPASDFYVSRLTGLNVRFLFIFLYTYYTSDPSP